MVRGIFTGKVRLDYARHRHPLWLAELEPSPQEKTIVIDEPPTPDEVPQQEVKEEKQDDLTP